MDGFFLRQQLPEKLRSHSFSKLLPDGDELGDPGIRFYEMEAAKLHGGWLAWKQLHPQEQAELMAHELHKNMRDHYYMDKRSGTAGRTGEPDGRPRAMMPHEAMRKRFFGG